VVTRVCSNLSVVDDTTSHDSSWHQYFDEAPFGFAVLDTRLRFQYINERLALMNGVAAENHIGRHPRDIVPDLAERVTPLLEAVLRTGEPVHRLEVCGETKPAPGEMRHWLADFFPLRQSDGVIFGVGTAVRDVTQYVTEKQRAESERRMLSMVVEQATESIIITDPDGTIIYVNPAFEKTTGYTSEEAMGKNPKLLQSGTHSTDFYKHLWDTLNSGKPWSGLFTNKRKDGTLWEEETIISPVRDSNGNLIQFVAIKRDITKERQAEDALLYYKAIVESSIDGIVTATFEGIITSWNSGAEKMFGYTCREAAGQPISLIVPSQRIEEATAIIARIKNGKLCEHYEGEGVCADGNLIDLSAKVFPVKDSEGRILGVCGLVRDITLQRRMGAEKELLNSKLEKQREQLKNIVKTVPGVVWEAWGKPDTGEQRINFVSDYVEIMLGYTVAEWLSTPNFWLSIVHPDDREKAGAEAALAFSNRQDRKMEFRWIAKDGHAVWVESYTTVVLDEQGEPAGMRGVTLDVTERKELEEQLRQSQKLEAIGQLAGGVAHDFNNLLTVINGYSDLAASQLKPEDRVCQQVKEIKKAGVRAAALTRQLLAFSRKQVLRPKIVDLNMIVSETEKMLHRLVGENIELQTELDPSLETVRVDPGQMDQVLMNLAVNARDAMPRGGTLTISTRNVEFGAGNAVRYPINLSAGRYVVLSVSDNGIGMDAKTQAHIFEPFFTTKEFGKGTGLGLSTVHGIVRQSGGTIQFESKLGCGTTFHIYLPRTGDRGERSISNTERTTSVRGNETILLVEDDDSVRTLARTVMQSYGYEVLEASDSAEALSISRKYTGRIHLVVTDVVMPGMDGSQLAKLLIRFDPQRKVLYMSGYTDNPALQSESVEHEHFIQKPFEPSRLAEKLREILDQAGSS
jgi:two-component system, cell cycle sensor histidine kinase and response regulator CckA